MLPKGRWRRYMYKGQKMGNRSKPCPGVYVGVFCLVQAPESQGRSQQDLARLSPIPTPSYPPQQHKGSLRLKQSLVALIQSTLQENVLILCVHDKS